MLEFIQNNFLLLIVILIIILAVLIGLMADGRVFKKKEKDEKKEKGIDASANTDAKAVEAPAVNLAEAAVAGVAAMSVAEDLTAPLEATNAPAEEAPLPEDIYTPIEEVPVLEEETKEEVAPSNDETIISVLDTPVNDEETFDFVSNATASEPADETFDFYPTENGVEETTAPVVDTPVEEALVVEVPEEKEIIDIADEQTVELIDESAFFNSHMFDEENTEETPVEAVAEEVVSEEAVAGANSFFDDIQPVSTEADSVVEEAPAEVVEEETTLPEVDTAKNAEESTEDEEWKF